MNFKRSILNNNIIIYMRNIKIKLKTKKMKIMIMKIIIMKIKMSKNKESK